MLQKARKRGRKKGRDNGFEEWGGYMNAKIRKLEAQFDEDQKSSASGKISNIFNGIAIFVNGFTEPSADELRCLMLQHGGVYHHYYRSGKTTHIIASSLPNAKYDQMKSLKIVKCEWIIESIKAGKLLDYKNFLLQNDFPLGVKKENLLLIGSLIESSNSKRDLEVPKTAADNGYLTEFYSNSRLHYISMLGAMLKQYVQDLRENHNGIFHGRSRLLNSTLQFDGVISNEKIIMHIDMDCFFVAVALRNHPHLKGKPVAVTHSKGKLPPVSRNTDRKFEVQFYRKKMKEKIQTKEESSDSNEDNLNEWVNEKGSMSEISSCSYEARKAGVRKGMYLGVALKLCPDLKTVPYDFEGYREVSLILYSTVAEYTLDIEAVSCDELFIDCTNLILDLKIDPEKFAEVLRREIQEKTNCTSSIGIGHNKLQARLATKRAKPDAQFYLTSHNVNEFMKGLDVSELPGVGRTITAKLRAMSVITCEDLQNLPLTILKKEFGEKTGEALYKHCRGEDDRKISYSNERKSVSAEINYGIRFNDDEETEIFLRQLSQEVSKRLKEAKMIGKNITFKVMYRAKDAPVETAKFLGHGACDQINRSVALPTATDCPQIISKHIILMYRQLSIPANELRGIGIQMTKLQKVKKTSKTLRNFLKLANNSPQNTVKNQNVQLPQSCSKYSVNSQPHHTNSIVQVPPASQIDPEVLSSLPEDIRMEILKEYGYGFSKSDLGRSESNPPKKLDDDEQARLLFGLNLKSMRTMIREWVATEGSPQEYDISLLKSYLTRLINEKKLESLNIIVKSFHRHIRTKRKSIGLWKTAFEEVICDVQKSMLQVFGKPLACDPL